MKLAMAETYESYSEDTPLNTVPGWSHDPGGYHLIHTAYGQKCVYNRLPASGYYREIRYEINFFRYGRHTIFRMQGSIALTDPTGLRTGQNTTYSVVRRQDTTLMGGIYLTWNNNPSVYCKAYAYSYGASELTDIALNTLYTYDLEFDVTTGQYLKIVFDGVDYYTNQTLMSYGDVPYYYNIISVHQYLDSINGDQGYIQISSNDLYDYENLSRWTPTKYGYRPSY